MSTGERRRHTCSKKLRIYFKVSLNLYRPKN